MAVDVLKILPKIGDVAVPSAGRQSQLSERILLEMIQRESSMQQQENKSALDSYKDAVASMNSEEFFGTTPYTQRIYERQQGKLAEFANALKEASTDSRKVNSIMLDYNIWKKTDPGMRQAVTEETALKDFHERTKNSTDKIDPVAFENMYSKINDPNRDAPLTFADLNPASITYDISKVGDDYIKAMTTSKDEFVKDEDANRISKQTTYTIPDDAEERLVKHYKENPAFKDYPEAKIRTLAKEKVDNFKLVNQNPKIDGNGENYSDDKRDELQKASSTEKLTYPEKVAQDLNEDGIKATFSNGAKGTTRVINGVPHVLDESGKDLGTAEDNWNDLSDQSKEDLRISGVGAGYDKYVVNGSGVALGEKGFERTAIESSGMALTDKLYLDGQGISKTKAKFTDGYLETNNPAVLRQAGFELEYDEANKKYKVRDIKTGTIYDEGKDSIFKTNGGSTKKGSGTEKTFSIKVDPIVKAAAPAPSNGDDTGLRNKNPFNVRDTTSGEFRKFGSLEVGYQAGVKDNEVKISGNSSAMKGSTYMKNKYKDAAKDYKDFATVEDLIEVRTPRKSNGGDNTDAMTDALINGVDAVVKKGTKLKDLTPEQKQLMNKAMVKVESPASYNELFVKGAPKDAPTPVVDNKKHDAYVDVLDKQYNSLGQSKPEAYKNSWSVRPKEISAAYDEFDKTSKGERKGDSLLTEAGYKAIDKFENTKGTVQGTSMNMGDGYSRSKEKEIKAYVEKNIGMDAWDKMPPKLQTQVYSFAFNAGTKYDRDITDDKGKVIHKAGDERYSTVQGLAQALAPDKIKTDNERQNLSVDDAKKIIRDELIGKAAPVTPPSTPPDTTNIYKAPPIDKKKTLQYK